MISILSNPAGRVDLDCPKKSCAFKCASNSFPSQIYILLVTYKATETNVGCIKLLAANLAASYLPNYYFFTLSNSKEIDCRLFMFYSLPIEKNKSFKYFYATFNMKTYFRLKLVVNH